MRFFLSTDMTLKTITYLDSSARGAKFLEEYELFVPDDDDDDDDD